MLNNLADNYAGVITNFWRQMAPDYDNLSLLQKVEVFEYALENTTGQDLYKVLWLKSKNSEVGRVLIRICMAFPSSKGGQ